MTEASSDQLDALSWPSLLSFLGISANLSYLLWRRNTAKTNRQFERILELPDDVTWLDVPAFQVLSAICDTLIPSINVDEVTDETVSKSFDGMYKPLYHLLLEDINTIRNTAAGRAFLSRGAIDASTHSHVAKTLEASLLPPNKTELLLVFRLLNTSIGSFVLTGFAAPFQNLSLENRSIALRRLRDSYLQPLRAIFQTFRRLTTGLFLSYAERGETNQSWELLNYNPRLSSAKAANSRFYSHEKIDSPPLPLFSVNNSDSVWNIEADVVIVGSGAGGGVMAHELVKAGLSVVVLEKGGYHRSGEEFQKWTETEAMSQTLERGGVMASKDGNIMILAGSCVGGGTTINWSASFDLPEHVRQDWESLGLKKFARNGEYVAAFEQINRLFNVNNKFSYRPRCGSRDDGCCDDPSFVVNEVNHHLWESATARGLNPQRIARNVKNCVDCGNCLFGCPYDSKQSTVNALLEPLQTGLKAQQSNSSGAYKEGKLTLIPHCYVKHVLKENGKAVGVAGVVHEYSKEDTGPFRKPQLRSVNIKVSAKVVVAACGALHTPALLLRSGLKNRKIGKHLTLHPVVGAATRLEASQTDQGYSGYRGVGMGVVVKNIEREQDKGWGSAIETPPFHSSMFGAGYFWDSGLQLKVGSLSFSKFCPFIAISRDHSSEGNCIELDSESGEPIVNYSITREDELNLLHGLVEECRLLRAGGSRMIIALHERFPPYVVDKSLSAAEEQKAFDAWIERLMSEGIVASKTQVFSAHQMSSCRMAVTPDEGVVNPDCESWELPNLFIADSSVFPTSLGINPMITIEALSLMTSRVIMNRLEVWPQDSSAVKSTKW